MAIILRFNIRYRQSGKGGLMSDINPTILLVDDEPFNLKILEEHLEDAGYDTVSVTNGLEAWRILEESHQKFDAVLLDRMMPEMDGMSVLKRMKSHQEMFNLPVVMQTAKAAKNEVIEGLEAGVHYYLTKPYGRDQLLAVVKRVVSDYRYRRELENETRKSRGSLALMEQGRFLVRTLDEAHNLAAMLAATTEKTEKVGLGLSELLVNALEHGNLGIGYEEKSELNLKGIWEEEIERRISLPQNQNKRVTIDYHRSDYELVIAIEDQGEGFDWNKYMEISPERAFDSHGRGIALANMLSFDSLEYLGKGNRVVVKLNLSEEVELKRTINGN